MVFGACPGAEESRKPQESPPPAPPPPAPGRLGKQVRSLGTDALGDLQVLEAQRVSGSQRKEDA